MRFATLAIHKRTLLHSVRLSCHASDNTPVTCRHPRHVLVPLSAAQPSATTSRSTRTPYILFLAPSQPASLLRIQPCYLHVSPLPRPKLPPLPSPILSPSSLTQLVQLPLVGPLEVEHVPHRLGHADAHVERVDDRLPEVLLGRLLLQHRQVHAVEVVLVPVGVREGTVSVAAKFCRPNENGHLWPSKRKRGGISDRLILPEMSFLDDLRCPFFLWMAELVW